MRMGVMVALLRGVNVGGSSIVSMSDVRSVATACGYGDVRSYVQSGNLVFSTSSRSTKAVADCLREALAASTSVRPEVMVRTREELRQVVKDNPFLDRGATATQLHVVFIAGAAPASLEGVDLARFAPEEACVRGAHLYLHLPNGAGRSKLAAVLARRKGPAGTMRNWRTVIRLVELADSIG
jgi:uncharacterized protein (DUF1697 family)